MPTVLALVLEFRWNLGLPREEIAFCVGRNLGIDAFSVAILAAQNPFRLVCHGAQSRNSAALWLSSAAFIPRITDP